MGGLPSCWPLPALEVTGQAALAHASSQRLQLDAAFEESSGWGRRHGPVQAGIRAGQPAGRQRALGPSGPGTMEGRARSLPSPPSVPDRGPPFSSSLASFLQPPSAPQPPAAVSRPGQSRVQTGPHFLSPLASSWCPCSLSGQGQWDAGFPGRCLGPPSCNSEMRPNVKHRKHRDPEPFPREEDPPGLALPGSRLL